MSTLFPTRRSSDLELVALAIALVALGAHARDIGARLGDLSQARGQRRGFLQHGLGGAEVAGRGVAARVVHEPARAIDARAAVALGAELRQAALELGPLRLRR